ncbi:alanyl-tRNA editing protein [Primorskyibacter flagellatus]|uniref:Ala-tRNA(Pro) hydrolase n=1 Tax=Primorskyibacter flagellatus TaxID=1387277 RepID=A0A1W2BNW9_9RHOB|nr:alanyl-tRNA editing protein [Primorskyibacter flagellatus]SMC74362.1 Ala-tRNA(Pro) hydrolase [Primorskyibacter flagellatus]
MTEALYLTEPYRRDAPGIVTGHTPEGGLVVHNPLFYPTGGGQPGDSGVLDWNGVEIPIATAVKADGGGSVLVAAEPVMLPPVGAHVTQRLDWERRHRHMRMHTALHLLSVVIALPVTGGQVSADRGRLDFNMPEAPEDRDAIEDALNALVDRDLQVTEDWITEAELDANPGLVKTMSVQPPRGAGVIRLVRIGEGSGQVDLQPCGGTHVARTGEIGHIRLGKIENKGRQNRRVNLHLR